jgi:uncharacterized protein YegP (UPF0339 family)
VAHEPVGIERHRLSFSGRHDLGSILFHCHLPVRCRRSYPIRLCTQVPRETVWKFRIASIPAPPRVDKKGKMACFSAAPWRKARPRGLLSPFQTVSRRGILRSWLKNCPNMHQLADAPFPYACVRCCACSVIQSGGGVASFSPSHCRGEEGLEKTAKFIIYQDFDGGYRWRLRSNEGATIAFSERGHHAKARCVQEMEHRKLEYSGVLVRDAIVRGFEKQLLSQWLASQAS